LRRDAADGLRFLALADRSEIRFEAEV